MSQLQYNSQILSFTGRLAVYVVRLYCDLSHPRTPAAAIHGLLNSYTFIKQHALTHDLVYRDTIHCSVTRAERVNYSAKSHQQHGYR